VAGYVDRSFQKDFNVLTVILTTFDDFLTTFDDLACGDAPLVSKRFLLISMSKRSLRQRNEGLLKMI